MDDVYVYCIESDRYLLVVNAANANKMRYWLEEHREGFAVMINDLHTSSCMIAVQGPKALARLAQVLNPKFVRSLKPRACAETQWRDVTVFASRTGYTGEDGLELITAAKAGPALWQALLDASVTPCGLGARDTLRLEAALLLYGNDMDETVNPFEVGLGWVVSLVNDDTYFIGRDALQPISDSEPQRKLVCLRTKERGVMRHGSTILHSGHEVSKVTSGGYSPTLETSIAVGFVPPELAKVGTELTVNVRGRTLPVRVATRPFYRRPKVS